MAGKGHPRAFKTEKEFIDKAIEYLDHCTVKGRFANVAGFAVFAGIHRDTFYAQQEYYSDAYAHVNDMLEDEALQHNTQTARMYLMNKFDYADKHDIKQNGTQKITVSRDVSTEDLRSMLED